MIPMLFTRSGSAVCLLLVFGLVLTPPVEAQDQLIAPGALWRYLDDGSNQGSAWSAPGFDDTSWSEDPAQLGYGDNGELTEISFGGDPDAKHTTTYFRHAFEVPDPSGYTNLVARVLRDDGVVLYLNGQEVARSNMSAGAVSFTSFASSTVSQADEHTFHVLVLDPADLVVGTNVLAVELHQRSLTSSDLGFDLGLAASDAPIITRGPYLQLGTDSSVRVRWRTDTASSSRVSYAIDPGPLTQTVDDLTLTTEHELELTGLSADTAYRYAVGTTTTVLAGDDADHVFTTHPAPGTVQPLRIWALGDSGTANAAARSVRDAYVGFNGAPTADVLLMLGDNAYPDGTDSQYQGAVFDTYRDVLRRTVVWPTRGNHENDPATYFGSFSMPTGGAAGGVPSFTEAYYSFDYANVHFVCLDSDQSDRTQGGPMWLWCEDDLSTTQQEWIVVFWHHPPYSKGSHDSDTESNLMEMRANFLPLLDDHGVDVVLGGHSHSYERSFLVNGHHGLSTTLTALMKKDDGDGRAAGTGGYVKPTGADQGAVYFTAGSSGKISFSGTLDHPVMVEAFVQLGSVILDVDGPRLDAKFLNSNGNVVDEFGLSQLLPGSWVDMDRGLAGTHGIPQLSGSGSLIGGDPMSLDLSGALENTTAFLVVGVGRLDAPFKGGVLVPDPAPPGFSFPLPTGPTGSVSINSTWPLGFPIGFSVYYQYWVQDAAGPVNFAASNALAGTTP